MKIDRIEIYKSPIKLKEPFVISLGLFEYAENIIVVISTDEGFIGYGECSPFMPINGECMETCFIIGQYLSKGLIGKDPLHIEQCCSQMDSIIYGNASIKSAFDIALHDIASQKANMPLYEFLGGKNTKKLVTDYTVSIGNPAKMASDALKVKEAGFQVIKVKLGESKEADVERIRLIRESVGFSIPIRIDANQGWKPEEAIEILKALAPYSIEYCEEPIPRWNYTELPNVSKQSEIPVMADESCGDHHDAKRLAEMHACDMYNIKLGKSSGIFGARKIILIAEQYGIDLQIGGFLESRLGFTASAHLALTSGNIKYYDFDTPLMFVDDPVLGGLKYDSKGEISVTSQPGLGASMDENYLKHLEKAEIYNV